MSGVTAGETAKIFSVDRFPNLMSIAPMFLAEQSDFKNLPERVEVAIPAKNAFPPADPKGKAGFDFSGDPFEANSSAATAIRAICAAGGSDAIQHLISRADDAIASLLERVREKDAKIAELEQTITDSKIVEDALVKSNEALKSALAPHKQKIAELEGMLEQCIELALHWKHATPDNAFEWYMNRKAGK